MAETGKPLHLFIDGALQAATTQVAGSPPAAPNIQALLARMAPLPELQVDEDGPETALERSLAQALGLPGGPGQVPWAAYQTGHSGTPCAWLRPCHWQLGMDSAMATDPALLELGEDESRALLQTLVPYLEQDKLQLDYVHPQAWLLRGEPLRDLVCCSLQRACNRPLGRDQVALQGPGEQALLVRRLLNEWQMLLADHPVNEAREDAGLWPANALWIDGAGVLEQQPEPRVETRVRRELASAGADPTARARAWAQIDASDGAHARQQLEAGGRVRLTLCGPLVARSYARPEGLLRRLALRLRPLQLAQACRLP